MFTSGILFLALQSSVQMNTAPEKWKFVGEESSHCAALHAKTEDRAYLIVDTKLIRIDDSGTKRTDITPRGRLNMLIRPYGLGLVDKDTAVLCGTELGKGVVLTTRDGGENWTKTQNRPGDYSGLKTPCAWDGKNKYTVGTSHDTNVGVTRSSDGGVTWKTTELPKVGAMNIDVADADTVYYGLFNNPPPGTKTGYYRSTDQGATFELFLPNNNQKLPFRFMGKNIGFYESGMTTDGGKTHKTFSIGGKDARVLDCQSNDGQFIRCVVYPGNHKPHAVYKSSDGGNTWTPEAMPDEYNQLLEPRLASVHSCFASVSKNVAYAANTNGSNKLLMIGTPGAATETPAETPADTDTGTSTDKARDTTSTGGDSPTGTSATNTSATNTASDKTGTKQDDALDGASGDKEKSGGCALGTSTGYWGMGLLGLLALFRRRSYVVDKSE